MTELEKDAVIAVKNSLSGYNIKTGLNCFFIVGSSTECIQFGIHKLVL